jgi:hypothetical protein
MFKEVLSRTGDSRKGAKTPRGKKAGSFLAAWREIIHAAEIKEHEIEIPIIIKEVLS